MNTTIIFRLNRGQQAIAQLTATAPTVAAAQELWTALRNSCIPGTADPYFYMMSDRPKNPTEIPNLDAMEIDELWEFWRKHNGGAGHTELFPDGGKGSKIYTLNLANYAANRATAMKLRLEGSIHTAQMYESICNKIYLSLPNDIRW